MTLSSGDSETSDERTPNPGQRELLETTEGIVAVDAGAGTGKTFALTRRYAHLVESGKARPDEILMVTFTRNAAEEMTDRIVQRDVADPATLRDAPINTFHGICKRLLDRHGFGAPALLGMDERIGPDTRLIENAYLEEQEFATFLEGFLDDHPEHRDVVRILRDRSDLLGLIRELAAKGIYPTRNDWYRDGESYLDGDAEAFEALFDEVNRARNDGNKQSILKGRLNKFDDYALAPDAPTKAEVRGSEKSVPDEWGWKAFEEDRSDLKAFVHDVYFAYAEHALSRNYLNFGFLLMFTYVLLCEDDDLRGNARYDYVMVDEFQDTNAVQFKLALLLCGTGNLCVVGDWKQSIYGFQHAEVENIRSFQHRLRRFIDEINADQRRIDFGVDDVHEIAITENYRSTQRILDAAQTSLTVEATRDESLDRDAIRQDVVDLDADTALGDHTRIEGIQSEDEVAGVLAQIQEIVGDEDYAIREEQDDGTVELRPPTHGDIAVLSRRTTFAMDLESLAREHGVPVAFEGGVNLFATDPAVLLLAWLRLLADPYSERGWAVILEQSGYTLEEVDRILDPDADAEHPDDMLEFLADLHEARDVGAVARRIFERYGLDDEVTAAVIGTLTSLFGKTRNWGRVARFISDHLGDADQSYPVDPGAPGDAVVVQTIHAAKGLEYPIVILADVNNRSFPSTGGGYPSPITYEDPFGLRQSKVYRDDDGPGYVYDNWHAKYLSRCRTRDYDEERRLLYVAMTRAEDHLIVSAEDGNASPFFTGLDLDTIVPPGEIADVETQGEDRAPFEVDIPSIRSPTRISATALAGDVETTGGMGPRYGARVHDFAHDYIAGRDVDPSTKDERNIQAFLDELDGDLRPEVSCLLPLEVNGRQVLVYGQADLIRVCDDVVEVVDWKTDRSREAQAAYRRQVSSYARVVEDAYPAKEIRVSLFYTAEENRVEVEPLTLEQITQRLREVLAENGGSGP